jgi:ribosome maturation factor RimP
MPCIFRPSDAELAPLIRALKHNVEFKALVVKLRKEKDGLMLAAVVNTDAPGLSVDKRRGMAHALHELVDAIDQIWSQHTGG